VDRSNIVLTGAPRSGTTLSCYLLNKLSNTVALAEPVRPSEYADLPDNDAVTEGIERFYRRMRRMALRDGVAISKNIAGEIPDNPVSQTRDEQGRRQRLWHMGKIKIDKKLTRDFTLVIKNPIMFTALLPNLVERFPCYAVVRNPLSVLASGTSTRGSSRRVQRLEEARREGRNEPRSNASLAAADKHGRGQTTLEFDKEITARLAAIKDPIERRLAQLSWFFERYEQELPKENVIRYEDIIDSGGKALSVVTPVARELDEPLTSMNLNEVYDRGEMRELGERLLKSEGAYWRFYSRGDVEDLLNQIS